MELFQISWKSKDSYASSIQKTWQWKHESKQFCSSKLMTDLHTVIGETLELNGCMSKISSHVDCPFYMPGMDISFK